MENNKRSVGLLHKSMRVTPFLCSLLAGPVMAHCSFSRETFIQTTSHLTLRVRGSHGAITW